MAEINVDLNPGMDKVSSDMIIDEGIYMGCAKTQITQPGLNQMHPSAKAEGSRITTEVWVVDPN
jgi:hypothetical protein